MKAGECKRFQWDQAFPTPIVPVCKCGKSFTQHPGRNRAFMVLNFHRDNEEFLQQLGELLKNHSVNALPITREEAGSISCDWPDSPLPKRKKG